MQPITYLENCLKASGKIQRWPSHCMPLTFYIAPFRWYKAPNEEFEYKQMVFDALKMWTEATEGLVSFKIVRTLNESQVNLDWRRVDRSSLGHCNTSFDNLGRIFSAEVQIGLSDGILHSKYQSKDEVFHTIIHEIGHAIGVNHSPYQSDIMFVPHQYGVVNLSERDKLTAKWLYKFPCGYTHSELMAQYGMSSENNIDNLIHRLEFGDGPNKAKIKSEFAEHLKQKTPSKDLLAEQNVLADINRYHLSLQNISISNDVQKYIKKTIIDKNFNKS